MSSEQSWKKFFVEGLYHLRCQDIDKALESFNRAISVANDTSYVPYDSRAFAYEKQNRLKDALRDAEKTIDIAPEQWHGYLRSARLLAALGQTDDALWTCSLALERLGDGTEHEARRRELTDLREHLEAQTTKCPVSGMPVELLLAIFQLSRNPVVISHVCHQWREIVLSQPTLWRSLVLTAPAEKALLKSRYQGAGGSRDLRGLLATLRELDWTEIKECHMEGVGAESFFSTLNDGTTFLHQHLETLSISCERPYGVIVGREYIELSWENLRAFSVINGGCYWEQLSTSMRHLTSFEYKLESAPGIFIGFHSFLEANPGQEKPVIASADKPYPGRPRAPVPLTLAHLRHLELTGVVPFRVERGNSSLPSLQILRMTRLKGAASMLTEFVKDEGTPFAELVELSARTCALGSEILSAVLLQAPKLEILICTGDVVNAAVEFLTKRPCWAHIKDPASEDPTPILTILPILCPALSVLDLSQSADLKTGPVMRMVKERIALAGSWDGGRYHLPGEDGDRGISCIQALKVDQCPHIEEDMLPWFQKNVNV
ncbi:hypothetical protein EDB92DRAFT_2017361 [Lactarius akahatsu]|uniref:F-box domain-containing protein n=1 Tax=Lactarius akahatsu TaxID=416441 RepID=A0AAD4LNA6_9AGAM|nr:hypothetical protein EDB92DRAFT_2017361 [Lactarius akahatsu]